MTFRFRQNDSFGSIYYVTKDGLDSGIASAAVVFVVRNAADELVFDDGPATAEDVVTAEDGSMGATLLFPLTAEAVQVPGNYFGYFKITYPGGAEQRLPSDDYGLGFTITRDYSLLGSSPQQSSTFGFLQSQTAHGFVAGDLVYYGALGWSKARADDATTLAAGIVLSVPDAASFRVAYLANQEVTLASHGLGSAGTVLYLSEATAGLATSSVPTSGWIQRIGRVKDANTLILWAHPAEPAA